MISYSFSRRRSRRSRALSREGQCQVNNQSFLPLLHGLIHTGAIFNNKNGTASKATHPIALTDKQASFGRYDRTQEVDKAHLRRIIGRCSSLCRERARLTAPCKVNDGRRVTWPLPSRACPKGHCRLTGRWWGRGTGKDSAWTHRPRQGLETSFNDSVISGRGK